MSWFTNVPGKLRFSELLLWLWPSSMKAERTMFRRCWDPCASQTSEELEPLSQDPDGGRAEDGGRTKIRSCQSSNPIIIHKLGSLEASAEGFSALSQIECAQGTLIGCHVCYVPDVGVAFEQVVAAGWEPTAAPCPHTSWRTLLWIRLTTAIPGRPSCATPRPRRTTHTGFLQPIPSKGTAFHGEKFSRLTHWGEQWLLWGSHVSIFCFTLQHNN